jgi:predicted ester cyclase
MATTEEQKEIFRRFAVEAWNKGNLDVVYETFAPEYHAHSSDPTHDVHGPKGHADFIATFREAFPDVMVNFYHVLSEGDLLLAHMSWTGTHKGPYMGIEPTGKQISVLVMGINRFEGSKVVEAWGVVDMLGMLQQLGVVPSQV